MKRFIRIIIIFVFLYGFACNSLLSQQQANTLKKRPKLGLVLSGGGAKGFAHIGAIKVFEEAGLHFDYIGGTSMGSIIGGLYAIGYRPDSMASMIRSQNWDFMMSDRIPRKYIPIEGKYNTERFIATFPISNRKIQMKQAIYQGQLIDMLLAHLTNHTYKTTDFSQLPTPFLCIGTNLQNGQPQILDKGILQRAIRASMSIPGYFTPTNIDGNLLCDGGVVDNFPVLDVKNMGADIIVGVDVQAGLTNEANLNTVGKVLNQLLSINSIKSNETAIKNTDYYIHPNMGNFDMMSFNSFDTIMSLGEIAAREVLPELKKLADSLNNIEPFDTTARLNVSPMDSIYISVVQFSGLKRVSKSFVEGALNVTPHSYLKIDDLEEGILKLFGSGFFSKVDYHFDSTDNGAILVLDLTEQTITTLGVGIHYDSDYLAALLLNGTFKNLIAKGSKLYIDLCLGENLFLSANYILDRGSKPGLGITFTTFNLKFDQYDDSKMIDAFKTSQNKLDIFMQITSKNTHRFRVGGQFEYIRFRSSFTPDYDDKYNPYANIFLNYYADTYDRSSFSTKGFQLELIGKYIIPLNRGVNSIGNDNALIAQAIWNNNIPISRKNTLKAGITAGCRISNETPPPHHWFIVGGQSNLNYFDSFIPFTGMRFIEKNGLFMLFGKFAWQYQLMNKIYLTAKCDVGCLENTFSAFYENPDIYVGYGLTVGYDSFIGPVELSIMGSNVNKSVLGFFNIGYWF